MKHANRTHPAFVALCDWAEKHGMRVELYAGELQKHGPIERREINELRALDGAKTHRLLCEGMGRVNATAKAMLTLLQKETAS